MLQDEDSGDIVEATIAPFGLNSVSRSSSEASDADKAKEKEIV